MLWLRQPWVATVLAVWCLPAGEAAKPSLEAAMKLPTFGDAVNIAGDMNRTSQMFRDGFSIDILSPTNHILTVTNNTNPLAAQFVSGSTGGPFIALSPYSYIVKMNTPANDLIARVELPFDADRLKQIGVDRSNTYVGTLDPVAQRWIVREGMRNVHLWDNTTRIVKMTSIEGEYILLGRTNPETSNVFVQYGNGGSSNVNFTGGPGVQEAEFVDGLRFSTRSEIAMTMNVNIVNGVKLASLPRSYKALNCFSWKVNTSNPNAKTLSEIRWPFNRHVLLAQMGNQTDPTSVLSIGKRALNSNGTFELFRDVDQVVHEELEDRISLANITHLDGEYVMLVGSGTMSNPFSF